MNRKFYEVSDKVFSFFIKLLSFISVLLLGFIIIFIIKEAFIVFKEVPLYKFVFLKGWKPTSTPFKLGIFPMVLGSIYVSMFSLIFALPIGLGAAILLSCIINKRIKNIIGIVIDLLAGIPSVIYGFFGLLVIVKYFEVSFNFPSGESVLAASILLSIMVLPYIISTCEESMEKALNNYKESSKSLGVSKWHMIRYLIIPSSKRAIISAIILAFSRAMGETMAVMMVIGNTPILPRLLSKAQTIPSLIALEMGGAQIDSMHYHGLFAAGLVLMIILFIINTLFYYLKRGFID
ncbi:MAG: phosphate ABC transporter permease subunit PstC [Firmicutes bacterium]|nr:phosphate ABC transporter permease subunit PstC [Bacillota bacterium]